MKYEIIQSSKIEIDIHIYLLGTHEDSMYGTKIETNLYLNPSLGPHQDFGYGT